MIGHRINRSTRRITEWKPYRFVKYPTDVYRKPKVVYLGVRLMNNGRCAMANNTKPTGIDKGRSSLIDEYSKRIQYRKRYENLVGEITYIPNSNLSVSWILVEQFFRQMIKRSRLQTRVLNHMDG